MNERAYFSGRIEDLISREQRGEPFVFSGFLTAEEAAEAEAICRRAGAPYLLYGGYPASERKMLAISSLDEETLVQYFPIVLLQIECDDADSLTHRDVLGALMALGIRRDVLGDIIVRDGCALFFAAEHIRDFLIQNLSSIGRQNVRLLEAAEDLKIPEPQFESLRITVASPRADAVVGALGRFSREQAAQLIEAGQVYLNHVLLEKKTKDIQEGDGLVIRGCGKWIVEECVGTTKKGRTVLICKKYV